MTCIVGTTSQRLIMKCLQKSVETCYGCQITELKSHRKQEKYGDTSLQGSPVIQCPTQCPLGILHYKVVQSSNVPLSVH